MSDRLSSAREAEIRAFRKATSPYAPASPIIDDLLAELDALREREETLRKALEEIEWVWDGTRGSRGLNVCVACGIVEGRGGGPRSHDRSCKVGAALAAAASEETTR